MIIAMMSTPPVLPPWVKQMLTPAPAIAPPRMADSSLSSASPRMSFGTVLCMMPIATVMARMA